MSLAASLVDRARVVRREGTPVSVEGRRRFVDEPGPWIGARLTEGGRPGTLEDGRTRLERVGELILAPLDENGDPVDLGPADELEVESADLGDARWQVRTRPEQLRRRRGIVAFVVSATRIEEPPSSGE